MKKSLLFLLIIIISSVVSIQLFIIPQFENKVRHPTEKWALEFLTSGSTDLLADQLKGIPKNDRLAYLNNIQANFGFALSLQAYNQRDFSSEQNTLLTENKILGDPFADLVYRKIDDSQLLVIVKPNSVPRHLVNEAQRWMMGTFYLLNNRLIQYPKKEWPQVIDSLSHEFAYPVIMKTLSELNYTSQQMAELEQGVMVSISSNDSDFIGYPADIVMQRIGNSDQVIVLGPFSPELKSKVVYMLSVFYFIFGFFLLIPIIIWLIPGWRSMRSLNKVAALLGQGKFETRAKLIRFSHLNNLSKTFNIMAEKIQRLISSHKNLVNAVSHELRTPIARIEFNLELLRGSTTNDYQVGQLDRIEISLNELNLLVSEMLTHARFDREAPTLALETVELNQWIKQELIVWQEANPKKTITLLENAECEALFDKFYMSRALSNLIRNAIAYGRDVIQISYQKVGKGWLLYVEDDGDGVANSARRKIFEAFYREDESRNLQTGGTGLGLAIVKQILDWHGGEASVDESSLGGARFIFHWPTNM
ncbi:ATP-binding protein [Pseudoalteromonas fuliginea]|uniref:ATP-binding protein n=1 Tax=Pseudoalteromonas fuliginea TaxID=1872678 RepID=UPI0031773BB2